MQKCNAVQKDCINAMSHCTWQEVLGNDFPRFQRLKLLSPASAILNTVYGLYIAVDTLYFKILLIL